jgi:hypothetical protein
MKIPLKEFEQHIDETILQRGYHFLKLINRIEVVNVKRSKKSQY